MLLSYLLDTRLLFVLSISNSISHNELGWGTDEKTLIRILGQRNAAQRKAIRETYLELYNESLIDRINAELSGDFRVCLLLVTSLHVQRRNIFPFVVHTSHSYTHSRSTVQYKKHLHFSLFCMPMSDTYQTLVHSNTYWTCIRHLLVL